MTFEQAGPVKLEKGDVVVVGTDGIWEAENENEEMFGKERLIEVIKKNNEKNSEEICEAVVVAVTDFCQPLTQDDDITIVIMKSI
jgi:sigma-B regulation protein RsbU (phosphoserine phosphatase)